MSEQIRETAKNADTVELESMMTAAVDIYREAMRQFIVRVLSDLPGLNPTEAVEQALTGENLVSLHKEIERDAPLDQALDVGQFSFVFREWRGHFRKYLTDDRGLSDRMWLIGEMRNVVSQKQWWKLTPRAVTAGIVHIVELLERIGEQDRANEIRPHLGAAAVLLVADERRRAAEPDRDELLALYEATGGDEWSQDDNWLSDRPVGEWWGVTTNTEGRVEVLDLRHNQLSGEIPHVLGNLTELSELRLSGNQLSGEIPPQLGDLAQLTNLDLSGNQLEGEVPAWLGDLSYLSVLNLSADQLTGGIPEQLGGLKALTQLRPPATTSLPVKIPEQLGGLKALTELGLWEQPAEWWDPVVAGRAQGVDFPEPRQQPARR